MNQFKISLFSKIISSLFAIIMCLTLTSCIQGKTASTDLPNLEKAKTPITVNTLKIVNAAFYQTFYLGNWRYKGAQKRGGKINAYIQIPAPLDLTQEIQKSYLRTAICPSAAHHRMWDEIGNTPLSIHIYTHRQKHSLYVDCVNPRHTG